MRSQELKTTSRTSLVMFVIFSVVCGMVCWFTTHANRVSYSTSENVMEEMCRDVKELNGTFCNSIHISYVVGVNAPDRYRPREVSVNTSVKGMLATHLDDVTDSVQILYGVRNPVDDDVLQTAKLGNKIKWELNPSPLHFEITLLLYIEGYPVEGDYEGVSCYHQIGWGVVCVLKGNGDESHYDPVVDFGTSQRFLVPKVLQIISKSTGRSAKVAKTCTTLRTLFGLLNTFSNLPLTADILSHIDASLSTLKTHPSTSLNHAMAAYTSHQLVTSAYFPPDHLFAIYLPLFFPIVATVLIGIVWEFKTSKREQVELQQKKDT